MSSKDSPEYKKLRSIWYRKLRKKGFKDIEHAMSQHTGSTSSSWYFEAHYSPQQLEEQARYYQLAGQLLHEHPFVSKTEKDIWAMHASGSPVRAIASAVGLSVEPVQRVIARISSHIVKR